MGNFRIRVLGTLFLVLSVTSCATSLGPQKEILIWGGVGPVHAFRLSDLELSLGPVFGDRKKTSLDLAELAARRAGLPWGESADGIPTYSLTVDLAEQIIGSDLDPVRSVSAVLKVWEDFPGGRQVGQVLFTETTRETLRSSEYMYRVFSEVFRLLGDKTEVGR